MQGICSFCKKNNTAEIYINDKACLCKKCAKTIFGPNYQKKEFKGNCGVEKERKEVIKRANSKGAAEPLIIDYINKYFDSKLVNGLYCAIKMDCEQEMYVYDDRIEINSLEDFSIEDKMDEYYELLTNEKFAEYEAHNDSGIIQGVMKKKNIEKQIRTKMPYANNRDKEVIHYNEIDGFKVRRPLEDESEGFMRFTVGKRMLLFFFDDYIDDCGANLGDIEGFILQKMHEAKNSTQKNQVNDIAAVDSIADTILKYKNLLDIGAITEEEFESKKGELLSVKFTGNNAPTDVSSNIENEDEELQFGPSQPNGADSASKFIKGTAVNFIKSGNYTAAGLYKASKKQVKKEATAGITSGIKKEVFKAFKDFF